jgi:hypothetical protein
MSHPTDFRPIGASLYVLPVTNRMPLKFGREVVTRVNCARVCIRVRGRDGREVEGWGETKTSAFDALVTAVAELEDELVGALVDGGVISSDDQESGVTWVPDPETDTPRYLATVRVTAHPEP